MWRKPRARHLLEDVQGALGDIAGHGRPLQVRRDAEDVAVGEDPPDVVPHRLHWLALVCGVGPDQRDQDILRNCAVRVKPNEIDAFNRNVIAKNLPLQR